MTSPLILTYYLELKLTLILFPELCRRLYFSNIFFSDGERKKMSRCVGKIGRASCRERVFRSV